MIGTTAAPFAYGAPRSAANAKIPKLQGQIEVGERVVGPLNPSAVQMISAVDV